MWLTILIIAIVVGGMLGFAFSDEGDRSSGAINGALAGGMGCGYILLRIFIAGIAIFLLIKLFKALF